MKKLTLATAIVTAMVSGSSLAATVYKDDTAEMHIGGRVEVRGEFVAYEDAATGLETETEVDGLMKDKSRARLNFVGKTNISSDLYGFAKYELETNFDADLETRYMYVGLGGGLGEFSYGKQDTANVQISDMTDIMSYHSGVQQVISAASEREANVFLYNADFGSLTLQADVQAFEADDSMSYGVSALWSSDFGLDLGGSASFDDDESEQFTFAAGYTVDAFYAAFSIAIGEYASSDEFTSAELSAQYKFTEQFRMVASYALREVEDTDTIDYFAVEARYDFNKNLRAIASYQADMIDDAEDSLMLGLRYDF